MKKIVIYGQQEPRIQEKIEKMKRFIQEQGWRLLGGKIDLEGICDGLFEIIEKIDQIDIIMIYNKENIADSFNYQLLFQLERIHSIEIIEYKNRINNEN